ncbi:MAG: desulfoferrodoxin [Spirochaetes bacterium]|nr:desulfoferrodoxin [Spirochaetota bacterium]
MPKKLELYKCDICGNITEVIVVGGGELVCCGQLMTLQEEKTADMATEKHVPVIEKTDNGYKVTVGSTLHPMQEDHYIQWIAIDADGKSQKKFLKPGDEPVAVFLTDSDKIKATEYCNKHGLWKGE